MSRPEVSRTASTNLSSGPGLRQLEGKLAVVTGASRGKQLLCLLVLPPFSHNANR